MWRFFHRTLLATALFFAATFGAHAVVLDWDGVSWTPGSLTNSYDVDPASAGNDVTVSITGDTGYLQPDTAAPMAQTPSVAQSLQGGLPSPDGTLLLFLNLGTQSHAVTVNVTFSPQYTLGVQNVSFSLFDVDFNSAVFQDQLRSISALSTDGTTLVAPTITVSPNNSVTGSGINQVVNGDVVTANLGAGSGLANVTISFGSTPIQSFTFSYGSGSNAPANPGDQKIGMHDLYFTPVPEINPAWSVALSCTAAAIFVVCHRARFRSRRK